MQKKPHETLRAARRFNRRSVLKAGVAAAAVGFTWKATGPFVRDAEAATLELRWLAWEHYNVKSLTAEFEGRHGVKVSAGFFDGNSEAWNKLRLGGTKDFDLVMADGFWPRLYAKQGLVQPVDYSQFDVTNVFPDFLPPKFTLLREDGGDNMIAAPNCWGGYGLTVNTDRWWRRTRNRWGSSSTRSTPGTFRPAPASRRTSRWPASWPPTTWARWTAPGPTARASTLTSSPTKSWKSVSVS